MKVTQIANCNNAPKNQKVADMVHAILAGDNSTVNELYEPGISSVKLHSLDEVEEVTIDVAISHGKSASCLCSYELDGKTHYIGFFLEFSTHKAESYSSIIVTTN